MNTLRPMFDYIVLDTPPCAMMADALAMCRHVDRVIYVIREDFAATTQIFEGIQALAGADARMAGFVFNCAANVRGSSSGYGYGYGYGSYGGKYGYYGYGSKQGKEAAHGRTDDARK